MAMSRGKEKPGGLARGRLTARMGVPGLTPGAGVCSSPRCPGRPCGAGGEEGLGRGGGPCARSWVRAPGCAVCRLGACTGASASAPRY